MQPNDDSASTTLIDKITGKLTAALQKLLGPKEPAIIGGVILALAVAAKIALSGGFDDGVQPTEVEFIAAPILAALGIRQAVFAPATVDKLAPRAVQQRVADHKHH
jgi:hypothetical protein